MPDISQLAGGPSINAFAFPAPDQVQLTAELFTAACTRWPVVPFTGETTITAQDQHLADLCFAAITPGYLAGATETAATFGAGAGVFLTAFAWILIRRLAPILRRFFRWVFPRRKPASFNTFGWPLGRASKSVPTNNQKSA